MDAEPGRRVESARVVTDTGSDKKTVFLVSQISSHGHLDMYARLYSLCLLELGYRVVLIAESDAGTTAWIAGKGWTRPQFNFYSSAGRKQPELPAPTLVERSTLLQRAVRLWRQESTAVFISLLYFYGRWFLQRSGRRLILFLAGWWPIFARLLTSPSGINFNSWVEETRAAESAFGAKPALVFFLYLDMFKESRASCAALARGLSVPWAGILFHPRCLDRPDKRQVERYFLAGRLAGAAFLNPYAVASYSAMFPGRVFAELPDITDAELPTSEPDLVRQVRAKANGRRVVLTIGSIAPHKGIRGLIDVISVVDPTRYYFVIVGEIFWASFGGEEAALRAFCDNPPENCFIRTGYIEREQDVNAIISAADVIYAVYQGFKDSSNTLTKAATFEKPVLVSDDYLMGERVRTFRLGAAVKFGDVQSIANGLNDICGRSESEFDFAAYRQANSYAALREKLSEAVKSWLDLSQASVSG